MLPTQGLFRSIPCPYYVSGLCERPHCLFRHTKSDVILARKTESGDQVVVVNQQVYRGSGDVQKPLNSSTKEVVKPIEKSVSTKETGSRSTLKRKAEEELVQGGKIAKSIRLEDSRNGEKEGERKFDGTSGLKNLVTVEVTLVKSKKPSSSKSSTSGSEKKEKSHSKSHSGKSSSSVKNSENRSDKKKEDKRKESSSSSSSHKGRSSKHRSHSKSNATENSRKSSKPGSSTRHTSSRNSSSHNNSKESNSGKQQNDVKLEVILQPSNSSISSESINWKENNSSQEQTVYELSDASSITTDNEDFSLPEICDYEDDPDEIELECLRLFEDYQPNETLPDTKFVIGNSFPITQSDSGKKRQAHPAASERAITTTFNNQTKVQRSSTGLHSIIAKRIESQKQVPVASTEQSASFKLPVTVRHIEATGNMSCSKSSAQNKKRIAHVSNVSGLLKPAISSASDNGMSLHKPSINQTIPKTTMKGSNRVAHLPVQQPKKRPIVNVDSPSKVSGKIPSVVRQKVLDQLFDAAVLIYNNNKDAFSRAVEEEAAVEVRSKTKAIYLSLAVSKVRAIRKEAEEPPKVDRPTSLPESARQRIESPGRLLNASEQVFLSKPRPTTSDLYKSLKPFLLSESLLVSNGFPRPHPNHEHGRAIAQRGAWEKEYVSEPTRRTCDRCRKVYGVTERGEQIHEDTCRFHPGRKNYTRVGRAWRTNYQCCGDESGSPGCAISNCHVPKSHPVSEMRGFVHAVQEAGQEELMGLDPWDVIALDCEMIYTTGGNALARVTVVGSDGNTLYDELVRQSHPILDYNTQYSGITPEMMSHATASINEVQAVLLTHLKPNSILIGHSLESDLIALRLEHSSVIDSSVLYPHKRGPPYKRALRTLTAEFLHKIIQDSEQGHDSAEDARAALDLAIRHVERARNGEVS